jgi:hypothetical protein
MSADRDSEIMDLLLESRAINEKLQAEKDEAMMKVQELQERNKALEVELDETRRLLIAAEKAIPVSRAQR